MRNMRNIKKLLPVMLVALAFVACDNDDETLEDVRLAKTVVTLDKTSVTATEGTEITFTLNVDSPNSSAMDYKVEIYDAGTTASFRDFSCSGDETDTAAGGFPQGKIGYIMTVPAYATSTTFTITPDIDLLKEGNEVLKLRLVSSGNGLTKINPDSEIITINIADYVSNDVGVGLTWDKQTNLFGSIIDTPYIGTDNLAHDTSMFDFDLYIFDPSGSPLNFDGATGANPELTVLDASLPDGDYYVYFEIYTYTGFIRPKVAFNHDMKLTMSKYGVWSTTISVPMTTSDSFADYVAIITKTGNSYVVTDYVTNEVLASGKVANKKPSFTRRK
jgi:hypothetical protein